MGFGARQGRAGRWPKHSNALRPPDPVLCLYQLMPESGDLTHPGERSWVVHEREDEVGQLQGQIPEKVPFEFGGNQVGKKGELGSAAVVVDEFTQEVQLRRWIQGLEGLKEEGDRFLG